MSTETSTDLIKSSGGARSELEGRAQGPGGGESFGLPEAIHGRLADEMIDELLEGVRTEEEVVGPGEAPRH